MQEDPYKKYKLWQKNLSIEYQDKLDPTWNRLIIFNKRGYGNIGFFLYKFQIKDSERGSGYGTKIIKEILDNNICNFLVIKNIADDNSLRFWNRIRDNIDYYILPNSNKIRNNILKLCKQNEWWDKQWDISDIFIFTSKKNEQIRCSSYNPPKKTNRTLDYRTKEYMTLKKEHKKYSTKCRKNQCWYSYRSNKCIPHFKKLTVEDPFYIKSPKYISNNSHGSYNFNFYNMNLI